MRNPISKRYPRELRNNLGKYLGIFLMMVFAVSFTSGFLLSAGSIETIIEEMPQTYAIEDGHFELDFEADDETIQAVESLGVTVHEGFYKDATLDLGDAGDGRNDITARVFRQDARETINMPAYAAGRAPRADDEVAFDRVFMNNHDLELDDMVTLGGKRMRITGVLTLPDYQAMFKGNNDFMFDALTFTVGLVGGNGYEGITGTESFVYPFSFVDKSLDLTQRTEIEEDMLDALNDNDAMISDFLDANDNQAIGYAMDDVVGDQAMWTALLFILIVIMAFVFVVLTGATIEQESSVIGTMLASGWRKGELIRHYLLLPAIIGFLACAIGLAIGVTVLDGPMKDLYYNSYSLPPFETIWNWRIVLITAVLPYVMLIGITFVGLARKLRFTPLQFLRHEVAGRNHAARIRLPQRLPYPVKFRTRVIVRNASHFVTLFCGIMFASLLLLFGTCMLPVVAEYANQLRETVKAPYEYVLKTPLELDGSDEEREMYAAALRLASDRERMDANKDAIDAAKRLRDNTELMDALERLMDNTELLEAVERLQEDQELMDAIERLRDRQDLLDAAERLQDQQYVIDAAQRLESKRYMIAAAQRLQSKQDIIAAAQRLQSKQDLVAAAQRMQEHPEVIAAAQHAQEGTATEEELMLLASLDEQTRADMELVASMDDQTRSDMEKAASMDEQTKRDIETVSKMDAQTKRDIQTVSNMSAQTRADIELISNLDQQTKDDLELLSNLEGQAKDDLQLIMDADQQTKDDIELLSNLDQATKDDIELVKDMDRDLLDDLRLAGKIDEDAHVVNTQVNDPGVLANTEKYAVGSLEVMRSFGGTYETITVYGIQPQSRYWTDIPVSDGVVIAGQGLAEKCGAKPGTQVTLENRREGETYHLNIASCASNQADTNLYMSLDDFNAMFGNGADYFNAYASSSPLLLDDRYVASLIVPSDMDKITDQMADSMGEIMYMMMFMAVPIYLVLMYLLTKTVIDRNSRSISYMKVFGYHNGEIDGLYIRPITYAVAFSLVASIPLIIWLLKVLLKLVFTRFAGNFAIVVPPERLLLLVLIGMATYAVVAILHMRRIRGVPLSIALKVQE